MQLKVTNKQPDCLVICISTLFSRPLHIFLTFESFYLSIGAKCPCFAISLIDWSCFIYFKLFFKLLTSFCLRISSIPSKHNFFSFLLPLHPLILFLVYFIFDLMYLFFVGDQSNSIDFFNFACFLLYPINAYSIFILFFFYCGFLMDQMHDLSNMYMKAASVLDNWDNASGIPLHKRKNSEYEHKN